MRPWFATMALLFASLPAMVGAEQQVAIAAIRKLGGNALWTKAGWEVELHLVGAKVRDRDLVQLARLKNLVSLNLKGTRVTSAGLVHLKDIISLQLLHLERTAIDDAGIRHLAGLTQLKYLNLYGTKVTDKSLVHLYRLKKLRRLYVWRTAVTERGAAAVASAVPGLKVVRGVDLAKLAALFPEPEPEREPTVSLKFKLTSTASDAPRSRGGENIEVVFRNRSHHRVKIVWVGYDGNLKQYGELAPGGMRRQNTYENNSWLITDAKDQPIGYFICGPKRALAVIPPAK